MSPDTSLKSSCIGKKIYDCQMTTSTRDMDSNIDAFHYFVQVNQMFRAFRRLDEFKDLSNAFETLKKYVREKDFVFI